LFYPQSPLRGVWGPTLTHILLMSLSSFLYLKESFRTCGGDSRTVREEKAGPGWDREVDSEGLTPPLEIKRWGWTWWLTSVTQVAEIWTISVQGQPG
jgi:hypothetical protein